MYAMAPPDLGIRIKRARERMGWTQQELAEELTRLRPQRKRPVGVRSVGRWERGDAVPRDAVGALEHLLGEDFTTNGTPLVQPDLDNPFEVVIWSATRYSVEERREFLLEARAKARAAASTG